MAYVDLMRDHLVSRWMVPEAYGVTWEPEVASIPLREFGGRWVGYQNYRPNGPRITKNVKEAKYFTYLPKKVSGYFGLESLELPGPIYVVEGVFKATVLHCISKPAIALMGSETERHKSQLDLLRRPYIGIGDNDDAGRKFAHNLGGFTSPRDLDEMDLEDIKEMLYEDSKQRY